MDVDEVNTLVHLSQSNREEQSFRITGSFKIATDVLKLKLKQILVFCIRIFAELYFIAMNAFQ